MRKFDATHIVVALAVLVNVVWMIDEWLPSAAWTDSIKSGLDPKAMLIKDYDQYPFDFSIDFDGDGLPDRLFIEQTNKNAPHELVVQDTNARDLLRLPCVDNDGVIRMDVSVYRYEGETRLLLSSYSENPERKTFGWDRDARKMISLDPVSSDEWAAVDLIMRPHYTDPGPSLNSNDFLWLRRGLYVLSLVILFAIYRYQKSSGTGGLSSLP